MRELLNGDMYLISEIIDKMNLKMPEVTREDGEKTVKKDNQELGAELLMQFARKVYLAKEPINKLLASVMEQDIKDVEKMNGKETLNAIAKLFGKAEIGDFFK